MEIPTSPQSEAGLLSCCLQDPSCVDLAQSGLRGKSASFFDPFHQQCWEAMLVLREGNKPIDAITLIQQLKAGHLCSSPQEQSRVSELYDKSPSPANLDYYLEELNDKWLRRELIGVAHKALALAQNGTATASEALGKVEEALSALSAGMANSGARKADVLVMQTLDTFEKCMENRGKCMGVSTGFADLDDMIGGMREADVLFLGARVKMGKTSLAMNIAEEVALSGEPVGIFELEMSAECLMQRMMCSNAEVEHMSMMRGYPTEEDIVKIGKAASYLKKAPLYIDDTAGLSMSDLRSRARTMARSFGIKLFVLDYIQLMYTGSKAENRQQEVAAISRGIKVIAKETKTRWIVVGQLNRQVEARDSAKPRMSDIKDSGACEADADYVGLLYCDRNNEDLEVRPMTLYLAGNRHGPTGEIPLMFFRKFTRFKNAAKIDVADIPHTD